MIGKSRSAPNLLESRAVIRIQDNTHTRLERNISRREAVINAGKTLVTAPLQSLVSTEVSEKLNQKSVDTQLLLQVQSLDYNNLKSRQELLQLKAIIDAKCK